MIVLNDDFKYVMLDTMKIYFGASYTYDEMLKDEHVPFKFQAIIMQYFKKEEEGSTTLAEHFYKLQPESMGYMTFSQLKPKIKFTIINGRKDSKGRLHNRNEVLSLKDFVKVMEEFKQEVKNGNLNEDRLFIQEIAISKMALMGFSV